MISQRIWVIGVSGFSILVKSIGGISSKFFRDRGVVDCNFIINFILFHFIVFHGVSGVGGIFAIYQQIWEMGVFGASILDGFIGGISIGCVGGRRCFYCNFIINFISILVLIFMVVVE